MRKSISEAVREVEAAALQYGAALANWKRLNEACIAGKGPNVYHCIAAGMECGKPMDRLRDAAEALYHATQPDVEAVE